MDKDYIRDYATQAFIFYGHIGSVEKYKRSLYLKALEEQSRRETGSCIISNPTEAMIMKANQAVDDKIAEIEDLEAVEKTLNEFRVKDREDIVKAIEEVYFISSNYLKRGNIKDRVLSASIKLYCTERTIYKNLRKARTLFAYNRGLRI